LSSQIEGTTVESPTAEPARRSTAGRMAADFLTKMCVALSLCVVLLAVGEWLSYRWLRSFHADKSKPPEFIAQTNPLASQLWHEWEQSSNNLQYKAFVVWRREKFEGQAVHVDDAGLRRTEYCDCSPGAYTIWMFGNSTLWGMGSLDEQTIPSQLAKLYQESGLRVCVRNYGEYGWVSTQELIQLMLELKANPQKPNLVIFYDGAVDSFLPYETDAGDVHGEYNQIRTFFKEFRTQQKPGLRFLRSTNTYRALEILAAKLQKSSEPKGESVKAERTPDEIARRVQANYLKNMELVELLGRQFNFQCDFFWQPSALVGPKPFTPEEEKLRRAAEKANPGIPEIYQATWSLMRQVRNPDFHFLGDVFKDRSDRVYVDGNHVGPGANQIISGEIFKVVRASYPAEPGPAQ
jgi:hypothetical protein